MLTGVVAVCSSLSKSKVAFPACQKGHVQIEEMDLGPGRTSTIIQAHKSIVAAISFNQDGTKIATASKKGTLVRVFDVSSGQLLYELRRGTEHAKICRFGHKYVVVFIHANSCLALFLIQKIPEFVSQVIQERSICLIFAKVQMRSSELRNQNLCTLLPRIINQSNTCENDICYFSAVSSL